jgi:glycosyltransferase involved in cell wall biosynthesis
MKKPRVTVVIPVYNTEKYLGRCLNSVLNQNLKEIEIICIDDGSTDNSLRILKEFKKKDKRIVLISKKNEGQAIARNIGIKKAQGEYIGFVDSDDWIDLNYFEEMYKSSIKNNAEMAMASMNYLKTNQRYYNFSKEEVFSSIKEKVKKSEIERWGSVCVGLFKKAMLIKNEILFEEGVYYEDVFFVLKCVYSCNRLVTVPKTTYFYANNPTSTINTLNEKKIWDLYRSRKNSINFARRRGFKIRFKLRGLIPLPLVFFRILTFLRIFFYRFSKSLIAP